MEVEIITTYICDKCGAKYEEDEKTAKRCEKLPIEKIAFKKGDEVCVIDNRVGKISAVRLYSPINNNDMTARFGISRKSHFYLYRVKTIRGSIDLPASHLELQK